MENLKLSFALNYAKGNSFELRKVIDHYSKNDADSLKLRAARFLIANMPGKGAEKFIPLNDQGMQVDFDLSMIKPETGDLALDFLNYQEHRQTFIKFSSTGFVEDIHIITSDYLIENIEYAFKAWAYPWAKKLTFDQFKELILPYRVRQEPLLRWRKDMFVLTGKEIKKNKIALTAVELAKLINDGLQNKYHYLHNELAFFPGRLSFEQIKTINGGRCDDLNAFVGCLLRSAGVPVALEFTPSWANSNYGGHSWLSVFEEGAFVAMNAIYDSPVKGQLPFKAMIIPKAYRERFFTNTVDEAGIQNSGDLKEIAYQDVTSEYVSVKKQLKIETSDADLKGAVFLGLLNGAEWKPVDVGVWKENGYAQFKNIGGKAIYSVIQEREGKYHVISPAFFIDSLLNVHLLNANKTRLQSVKFRISDISKHLFKQKYHLVFWNHINQSWETCGAEKVLNEDPKQLDSKDKYIKFSNVPSSALFRVVNPAMEKGNYRHGRPFVKLNETSVLNSF